MTQSHGAPGAGGPADEIRELLEHAQEIALDVRLEVVREWKRRTGGLAIGYMPIQVPREILHAQGCLPVGIVGGGEIEIIRGDAYYQSYICHIPRSTIELGLNGSLDCLDGMVFPAICDVIRNLSGMWQMLFPDRLSHYLDVPQDFQAELGGAFYRRDLEDLSEKLVARGARPLDADALRQSIRLCNDSRAEVHSLYALRRDEPWKVPTHELYLLLRAGLVLDVEEHIALLRRYRGLVADDETRRPLDQARVVLVGCFCEQPPLGLIKTLERAGCYVVDDDLIQVHRWFTREVAAGPDPLGDLVSAYLKDSIASPVRYIDDAEKGADLVRRVRESGAEGVIFSAASFCDPALLDQPMAVAAVEKAGIPWTAFKFAENTGQFQVIREQAGTFADSIKLWSGVS